MRRLSLLALSLPLALAACDEDVTVCTEIAVAGFTVDLGGPVNGTVVTWSDGERTDVCEEVEPGRFACAWEASGDLSYTVTAPEFETVEGDITVSADECHPIPELVPVELVPAMACTMEARPSLILNVFGLAMDPNAPYPIEDATVTYTVDGGASADCVRGTANDYTCGYEQAGAFHFVVSASAHGTAEGDVTVTAGTCHVGTVEADVTLDCIAC